MLAFLYKFQIFELLPEEFAAILEEDEDIVESIEFIEDVSLRVIRRLLGAGDEFEAALDAPRVVESLIDAKIELYFLLAHLVPNIVPNQLYNSQPNKFKVGVAVLQKEEEFLLHEVELGEIGDGMAD